MAAQQTTVLNLFNRVNLDLARKDRGGYTNSEEFNRSLHDAQSDLAEYYYMKFEIEQKVPDALIFLIKTTFLPIVSGVAALPDNYRHRLAIYYRFLKSDNCTLKDTRYPLRHRNLDQIDEALNSPIRKASLEKRRFYHYQANGQINVLPKTLTGNVELMYLINPPEAKYGVILNPITQQEEYDPLTSVDPFFPLSEEQNLIDMLLYYKGVEIREGALLEFVQMRTQMRMNVEPQLNNPQ